MWSIARARVAAGASRQLTSNPVLWTRPFSSLRLTNPELHARSESITQLQNRSPTMPTVVQRQLSTKKKMPVMSEEHLKKRLDEFQDLFTEARLCIEDAEDAMETTYFDEEAETAKDAVNTACAAYTEIIEELLGGDGDQERANLVRRSNGLKVEQLKGEIELTLKGGH